MISARALSPLALVSFCWAATLAIAGATLLTLDRAPLIKHFLSREGIDLAAFTWIGAAWICIAFGAYVLGDRSTGMVLPRRRAFLPDCDLNRAAKLVFYANLGFLGVTALWIMLSAAKVGGIVALAALVFADSLTARDILLENKLFTGMRLFYAALPATGCLAAAVLAAGGKGLSRGARHLSIATLVINGVALFVLPLVMSQRLLLLQFVLSAYIATCVIRGRLVYLPYLVMGAVLFLATWAAREAITNPTLQEPALHIARQKLAFYFVNDLWNSFAPLSTDIPHSFGYFSLKGALFFTFTDGVFHQALAHRLETINAVRGGGEFSVFTAPFVDFGVFGGAAFIALLAGLFRVVYHRAKENLLAAAIYGQIGAALLFSTHSIYVVHHNFLFSLLAIWALVALSRRSVAGVVYAG